ncbi:MAG: T9SS type A sorting domain-containing protein, partial [Bacteroidales bacterium]|nr:T9SS type A sorting domain-containing protein [Bacteroidales bacterium]
PPQGGAVCAGINGADSSGMGGADWAGIVTYQFGGHVRIYENQNGTWTQIGQDIDGGNVDDFSGWSVDISSEGSVVAVGAPRILWNNQFAGSVRVFENQSGTWTQIGQNIEGEIPGDCFGYSVSLSSNGLTLAVGAPGALLGGSNNYVRIFENQSGTWTQIGQNIDGEAEYDKSGTSVSLSYQGSIVAIGAPYNYGNNNYPVGHVRIFENQNGTWTKIGMDIDGEAFDDHSGTSVSLSSNGSIIAIGAPWNTGNGYDAGHVRVFQSPYANISEKSKYGISIHPNPTTEKFILEYSNNNIKRLVILNIAGKQVIEKTELQQKETIDLSNFESGIYIVSIQTDNEVLTTKIIKR